MRWRWRGCWPRAGVVTRRGRHPRKSGTRDLIGECGSRTSTDAAAPTTVTEHGDCGAHDHHEPAEPADPADRNHDGARPHHHQSARGHPGGQRPASGLPAAGEAIQYGCPAALAYLATYAAPALVPSCPGDAGGHQARTICWTALPCQSGTIHDRRSLPGRLHERGFELMGPHRRLEGAGQSLRDLPHLSSPRFGDCPDDRR